MTTTLPTRTAAGRRTAGAPDVRQGPARDRRPTPPDRAGSGPDRSRERADRPGRDVRVLAWVAAALLTALYATLSVRRHHAMLTTGFDLGIFEQEVRSYAHLSWPTSDLKAPGFPLLGDHFSPIVALLAPVYRLFPSAQTLLVAQAVLLAVGVVPLVRWAGQAVGRSAAVLVAVAYGSAWGIAGAVVFDFHEVAFAVPLVSASVVALGRGRLRQAVLWAAPLVLVKEDLGLTLAAIGLLVLWRGERRWGAAAVVGGVVATAVEMLVVLPAVNPAGANAYTGQVGSGGLLTKLTQLLTPETKVLTIVALLAPTVFLAVRSPLLLVVLPTLAWRFTADNPAYWGTGYHYSAVLVPIVLAAFVDGLTRVRRTRVLWLVASAAVVLWSLPGSALLQVTDGALWRDDPHTDEARTVLAMIPDGATVAASNSLAPQLTARTTVSLVGLTPIDVARPEYVVVDTAQAQQFPVGSAELRTLLDAATGSGYTVVVDDGDLTLLHRVAPS